MEKLDGRINWREFYSRYVNDPRPCGRDKLHALCPFHSEKHPSFWFNTKNGCFKCESCGASGNGITFLEQLTGISRSEAYKQLCELAGVSPVSGAAPYDTARYAGEKRLSVEWLKSELGVKDGRDNGGAHIKIPYRDRGGNVTATRKRYDPKSKPYFKWARGSVMSLYGLWRLEEGETSVIIVEGESDAQSLWTLGMTALGVPGATTFKPDWCAELAGFSRIYLHIEPDMGGETFRAQMLKKLHEGGYAGEIYTFDLRAYGVKDPSELYIKHGTDAAEMVAEALGAAQKAETEDGNAPSELVPGMPIKLRQPEGWRLCDDGIFKLDVRTGEYCRICRTPLIITSRILNTDTDEERVGIAFKRGETWREAVYPPTVIYRSQTITELADVGVMVNSENAKHLVSFLDALEAENTDLIKQLRSVSQLGWVDKTTFLPYHGGDIVPDSADMKNRLAAYACEGELEAWKSVMAAHRDNHRFRFMLASSFAAPLLSLLDQRIFFVYNWGGSEGGKTAALHAALSVWGDPDRLKASFNATKVGLEYAASMCRDLPMGLDERQLAGDRQETIDQIVYMLAGGSGKLRGTKSGGLRQILQWRTIVLATGEVELSASASQTGVSTRVLELYGSPFEDKLDASRMYPFTAANHGHAGAAFMERLIAVGKAPVAQMYETMAEYLRGKAGAMSVSHVSAAAVVAVADVLASMWIWGTDQRTAAEAAARMAETVLKSQQSNKERDVNENALRFTIDWLTAHREQFTANAYGERCGFIKDGAYYIIPSVLETALKGAGYTKTKTLRFFDEKGLILKENDKTFTVRMSFETNRGRYISFDFDSALRYISGTESSDFEEVKDLDNNLPFCC